ncbi:MAG: DUF1353 domain-containing protein [Burkholderiales bacterium]
MIKRILVALPVLILGVAAAMAAGVGTFLGKVVLEWDDEDGFNRHKIKLLSDFGFQDPAGKKWVAQKGAELDGSSFTPLFEQMVGLPFVGEHRRASLLHDYYAKQLSEPWRDVRRMYYAALLAEGMSESEAKTTYAVLYGAGMRWEPKGSTCYINCHNGASTLVWRPDVIESEINTALEVLSEGNPSLDDIDKAVDAVILKPGPHLFSQSKREDAASPVTGSTGDGSAEEE